MQLRELNIGCFGGGTGLNPVRQHFTRLLSSDSTPSEAQAYLRHMEDIAVRLDKAFPQQYADAKKTLRDDIAGMRQELAKKRGQ